MTILHPIYTNDDLENLSIADRQDLARHIHTLLQNDEEVKTLLRGKTAALFERLRKKK